MECSEVFPRGLGVVSEVKPLADLNASTKEHPVRARDKESGLPMWQVEVLDFDEQAREKTYRVKIAAAVQPVPPEAVAGLPIRPVVSGEPDRHPVHRGRAATEDRLQPALHWSGGAGPAVGP